jgi:hypothetical protein
MLVRIARVVWWIGLLIAAIGTSGYVARAYEIRECAATSQSSAGAKTTNGASARLDEPDQAAKGNAAAWLSGGTKADSRDMPQMPGLPPTGPDSSRGTVDPFAGLDLHSKTAPQCQATNDSFGLVGGWGLAFALWALAYILGGSFWLPPKRSFDLTKKT